MSFSPAVRDENWPPPPAWLRRDNGSVNSNEPLPARSPEPPEPPPAPFVDIGKIEAALARKPLDEIAEKIRALTYGGMIEFAEAIWRVNAGVEITQEALPAALHRWATLGGEK